MPWLVSASVSIVASVFINRRGHCRPAHPSLFYFLLCPLWEGWPGDERSGAGRQSHSVRDLGVSITMLVS